MNTKNTHFVPSKHDALIKMREISGGEVLPCVFPSNIKTATYYISEYGDLFTVSRIAEYYAVFGPKRDKSAYMKKGKNRKDDGITYVMEIDATTRQHAPAEKLVYCTFILGRWVFEDIKILFKDGNARNIRLDNLFVKGETWKKEWTERMNEFTDVYLNSFNKVARVIRYKCHLMLSDAEDITQSTFIYLMQRKDGPFTEAIWVYWAERFGWKKRTRHDRRFLPVGEFYDRLHATHDEPYEIDLLRNVKGKDKIYAQFWMNGVRPQEIAEMYGKTRSQVSAGINRAKLIVKSELRDEKELLGC